MNIKQIPFRINMLLFLITLYLNLMVQWDPKIWTKVNDPKDYLHQANISVFSRDFFSPKPEPGFYPRPFTVPLFYKLAGSQGETIVQMQKFIHSFAVFVLVYAMLLLLKTGLARYFIMVFIYFMMSWWNILGWTTQLLSESLSLSFLFLWIGTFLIYYSKRTPWFLLIHGLVTVLFSFTRDSWPYLLILLYGLMIIFAFILDKPMLKGSLTMLLLSLAIYFVQGKSSEIGERTKLPVMNSLVLRIVPDPDHFNWFVVRGLPMAGYLKHQFTGLDLNKEPDIWKVFALYTAPEYKPFRDWAAGPGKGLYMNFLITHPGYSLLVNEPDDKLSRILAFNLNYVTKVNGYSLGAEQCFPFFSPLSWLILILLLSCIFIKTLKPRLLLPILFSLLFLFNVILIYNADTMEVERHLFFTQVMVEFLSIWTVGLLIDELILKMRSV